MTEHLDFTNIREVLSRLLRNPMMSDLSLEETVQYTLDFIGKMGLPNIYEDKLASLEIHNFRAPLPCDLVNVLQVKNMDGEVCLRYNTDSFMNDLPEQKRKYDNTYKIQGNMIYVTFREGKIELSYRAARTDEEGLPMIPSNPKFLTALELYIKLQKYTIKFESSSDWTSFKINSGILNSLSQEYCFAAAQCNSAFVIPSTDEMESVSGVWNQLVVRYNEHRKGFRNSGAKEWINKH